jgi:exopolyphosphatase/pppGpp-phosphohydrolase
MPIQGTDRWLFYLSGPSVIEEPPMIEKPDAARPVPRNNIQNKKLKSRFRAVLRLAEKCDYDRVHSHRVARLALRLFDELKSIHGLRAHARFWLKCGAVLHDIGKGSGKSHHKTALKIVLSTRELPFGTATRRIIGLIARYHRKAMPSRQHRHFAALKRWQRKVVRQLAAILRIADALDSRHHGLVKTVHCEILSREIVGRCELERRAYSDYRKLIKRKVNEKGVLLEKVFNRKLSLEWHAA